MRVLQNDANFGTGTLACEIGISAGRAEVGGAAMSQPARAQEPSMEEILASIRRIISEDAEDLIRTGEENLDTEPADRNLFCRICAIHLRSRRRSVRQMLGGKIEFVRH